MRTVYGNSKHGIGIIEVLVAALVLGILYAAVSNLQKGNREALLRIRGRDGATEVAQNVIDSLSALGLAKFMDSELPHDAEGNIKPLQTFTKTRTWKGQPGLAQPHTMTVTYDVVVTVSPDNDYKASTTTQLLQAESSSSALSHVYAKRLDVTVSWLFKNSRQSISVSGVIR